MKIGVLILKIILINPSPTVEIENRNNKIVKRQNTYPPLGLLYLGEILSREGHNVKILDQDVTGASPAQILESIKKFDPNIVGLSPLSPSFNISMEIAKLIKNWNPNINLIVGNILATLCSDLILKDYPFVDYCVRGEAEKPLPNLIDVIEKNKLDELENVRGITFRKDNKIKMTPNAKPIKDLDEIPFPDRNLIDYNYTMSGKKFTILATSRGCPFNCKFCGIHINSGLKGVLRVRSLKNVIDELKYLEDCGYEEISFVDDCFVLNQKRTVDLCLMMQKEKFDFSWGCEGRVDQANIQLLRTMEKSNCKSVLFGIESANKRMLNYYNKRITPEISQQAIKNAHKARIENIIGLFILGGPGETLDEINNTIKFSMKLDLTFIQYQYLYILMGSDLWKELEKKNIVSRERDWKKYIRVFEVLPNVLGEEILEKIMVNAYAKFLSNPKFIRNQILKTMTSKYRINLIENSIKALLNKIS
ncbi:MAG: B12-binding domain-containing radical SAM protein [Candidatus Helarchaeota archaeon]